MRSIAAMARVPAARRSGGSAPQARALVDSWLDGSLDDLRQAAAGASGELARSANALVMFEEREVHERPNVDELNAAVQAAIDSTDGELLAIHLFHSSFTAATLARFTDAARLVARAERQGASGIRAEISCLADIARINYAMYTMYWSGERKRDAAIEAAIASGERLRPAPGTRPWTELALAALRYANWVEDPALVERWLEASLPYETALRATRPRDAVGIIDALVYARHWQGRFDESLAALAQREEIAAPIEHDRSRVSELNVMLLIGLGRVAEAESMIARYAPPVDPSEDHRCLFSSVHMPWMRAWAHLALAKRDYARAEAIVRAGLAASTRPLVFDTFLLTYKAELELAQGRASPARQALEFADPQRTRDDLLVAWARLHLLERAVEPAAECLARLLHRHDLRYVHGKLAFAHECHASEWSLALALALPSAPSPVAQRSPPAAPQRGAGRTGASGPELIGESPAIRRALALINTFAGTDAAVLVQGETGTGKEIAAQLLHQLSPRASEPFIAVNCGALSDTLVESELFGHAKGAFTGAADDYDGLLVSAGAGTIFLDEITSMSQRLQAALLRVLESHEVRPVGGTRTKRMRARVIAAANRPLLAEVEKGAFRSDLFYRLARLTVELPPLRERAEDIPALARHFLAAASRGACRLSDDILVALQRHRWPGNVRELKNAVERMAVLAGGRGLIDRDIVPATWLGGAPPAPRPRQPDPPPAPPHAEPAPDRHRPRIERLRDLFQRCGSLTRAEIIQRIGCSPNTATKDLEALVGEGFIRRVITSGNLRTSYFERIREAG
jgi:DNA-binding NtrC family response regulator